VGDILLGIDNSIITLGKKENYAGTSWFSVSVRPTAFWSARRFCAEVIG
jgi:hypothetical protein